MKGKWKCRATLSSKLIVWGTVLLKMCTWGFLVTWEEGVHYVVFQHHQTLAFEDACLQQTNMRLGGRKKTFPNSFNSNFREQSGFINKMATQDGAGDFCKHAYPNTEQIIKTARQGRISFLFRTSTEASTPNTHSKKSNKSSQEHAAVANI